MTAENNLPWLEACTEELIRRGIVVMADRGLFKRVVRDAAAGDPDAPAAGRLPVVEVHNAWQVEESTPSGDGTDDERYFSFFGRPQDWGDPRWAYHRFRFEMEMQGSHYIHHCHIWTTLRPAQPGEMVEICSGLITLVAMPGKLEPLCDRSHLAEEDFWDEAWGPQPPYFLERDPDDGYAGD